MIGGSCVFVIYIPQQGDALGGQMLGSMTHTVRDENALHTCRIWRAAWESPGRSLRLHRRLWRPLRRPFKSRSQTTSALEMPLRARLVKWQSSKGNSSSWQLRLRHCNQSLAGVTLPDGQTLQLFVTASSPELVDTSPSASMMHDLYNLGSVV